MTYLVSIISEQTIPNFLIMTQYKDRVDGYIFLTTQAMETSRLQTSRSQWLAEALNIPLQQIQRVILKEDDYFNNLTTLQKEMDANHNYILNITGGTKILTLSAYDFFKSHRKVEKIIYLPIAQSSIKTIFPQPSEEYLQQNITLRQYLTAYGLKYTDEMPKENFEFLKLIFKQYRNKNYDINRLNEDYPNEHKNYYTGGWFEDYVYYKVKQELQLDDSTIGLNIKIAYHSNSSEPDNEFDIMFVYRYSLYIFECKASLGKKVTQSLLEAISKLGSVKQNFGLNCKNYLVTLVSIPNIELINRRAKIAGIKQVIDRNFFVQNQSFNSLIV